MTKEPDPKFLAQLREESERTKDQPYPPSTQPTRPNSDAAEQRLIWSTLEGTMHDDFDEPLDDYF